MRKVLMIVLLFTSSLCKGQTLEEWTQQKKTQIKYLVNQIAANKVYIEYLEKGYGIARTGLNTIQHIKKGDFDLHREFISSLSKVNPTIKSYSRVADILAYQVRIVKNIHTSINNIKESNQFNPDELDYCRGVFDNLLEECFKNMDELYLIITSDELQVKDNERIKRIDRLYFDMQDKYSFCESFSEECSVLAMHRLSEQSEMTMSKEINGLQ
jgi:hypothetical protein